jgi:hypothetical protein
MAVAVAAIALEFEQVASRYETWYATPRGQRADEAEARDGKKLWEKKLFR